MNEAEECAKRDAAAAARLKRAGRALTALRAVNRFVAAAQSEAELFTGICRLVVETGGYRLCWVAKGLSDPDKTAAPLYWFGYDEGYLDALRASWGEGERARGPAGTALRTGTPRVVHTVKLDPDFAPWRGEALKRGYNAVAALPFTHADGAPGALVTAALDPDAFDEHELAFLADLADTASFGAFRLAERRSVERERRWYRSMLEGLSELVFVVDGDGRVSFKNQAALAFQRAAGERDLLEVFPASLADGVEIEDADSGRWFRISRREVIKPDGKTATLTAALDVTASKKAAFSAERFRLALDEADDAVFLIDRDSMRFLDVNRAAERRLGYSRAELLAMGPDIIKPDLRRDELESLFDKVLEQGGGAVYFRTRHRCKDGSSFEVEIALSGAAFGRERPLFIAVVRDITERRQIEEALKRAKEAAEDAAKAKSGFLRTMSHEMRTPLHMVIGMTEITLDSELGPDQRGNLTCGLEAAKGMLKLVNDALDYMNLEADSLPLHRAPFSPRELASSVVDVHVSSAIEKSGGRLALTAALDPSTATAVVGDAVRLVQVLGRLVENAVKFSDAGEIVVGARIAPGEPGEHGAWLELSVADQGPGVPGDKREAVFEVFHGLDFGADRQSSGTGLGLALARRLVEHMGGKIWVEDNPGGGALFKTAIPVGLYDAAAASESTKTVAGLPEGLPEGLVNETVCLGLRVLVVEDDRIESLLAERLAGKLGCETIRVDGAAAALRVLASRPVDLVLMDLELADGDGWTLAGMIRSGRGGADPKTLIVAVTANEDEKSAERFLAVGMDDWINKPLTLTALARTLERLKPRFAEAGR